MRRVRTARGAACTAAVWALAAAGAVSTQAQGQPPLRPPASAPGEVPQPAPRTPAAPPAGAPQSPAAPPASPAPAQNGSDAAPTAQSLGLPIYPTAQYLASYDAGRDQQYVLFGTTAPYAEVVAYYRNQLSDRGDQVFREPLTHVFEVGRFRQETMAFPPGVTVKDWTFAGSQGYPHPQADGQVVRFPTVIMLVPQPPAPAAQRQ